MSNTDFFMEEPAWVARRREVEALGYFLSPVGRVTHQSYAWMDSIRGVMRRVVQFAGLHEAAVRKATEITLNHLALALPGLPAAFDGYRILHITDLHLDLLPDLAGRLREIVSSLSADLVVMTGDYFDQFDGAVEGATDVLREIIATVTPPHGAFATLGNHDSHRVVPMLARAGLRVLFNETVAVVRGDARIMLTGIDDPSHFFSRFAVRALAESGDGFKIALVHSPELADVAARCGFSVYLAGHTHGGQFCFPWRRPVFSCLRRLKRLGSGLWEFEGMVGYTSSGAGVSRLPYRLWSRGEITLLTLRSHRGAMDAQN